MIVPVANGKQCYVEVGINNKAITFLGKYVTTKKDIKTKIILDGNGFLRLVKGENFYVEVEKNLTLEEINKYFT